MEKPYGNALNSIAHPDGDIEIHLLRGVKQCELLSPFLFNLVLERLVEVLEETPGYGMGDTKVSSFAFACCSSMLRYGCLARKGAVKMVTILKMR